MSRIERGRASEIGLGELVKIADALDISLRFMATWRGGELERLLNSRHSALHESVARRFIDWQGWEIAQEVSYSSFGERGIIDVLAWHAATRTLLVIELKTEIVDINELMGKVDQKRRLATEVAETRGWKPLVIAAWVIVADSATNRRRVRAHATVVRAAFPSDARAMSAWVAHPTGPVSGLSFWSNAQQRGLSQGLAAVKRVRVPRQGRLERDGGPSSVRSSQTRRGASLLRRFPDQRS